MRVDEILHDDVTMTIHGWWVHGSSNHYFDERDNRVNRPHVYTRVSGYNTTLTGKVQPDGDATTNFWMYASLLVMVSFIGFLLYAIYKIWSVHAQKHYATVVTSRSHVMKLQLEIESTAFQMRVERGIAALWVTDQHCAKLAFREEFLATQQGNFE
ncbi:hypothetical protein CLF_111114 [Clonorchis sinensis]|uniref:Uncharacterized protein n=1 Tax=Clonorchis sinensis TaxID=79923 RepID=G7YUD7_CLOSI|nr:hypothetical protein CLF_111114 [Clonorchis sinensis]